MLINEVCKKCGFTKKALEIETMKSKQELAQRLAQNQDWEYTRLQLEILEQKQTISDNIDKAIQNPEQYIADNQEILKQYMGFKQSDEYKKSSAYKLHELFATFHRESGYDEVFIKKYPNEVFQQ